MKLRHGWVACLLLLAMACTTDLPQEASRHQITDREAVRDALGQSLAVALQSPALRQVIKTALLETFDGDYNTLWLDLTHRQMPGSTTVGEYVWQRKPLTDFASLAEFNQALAHSYPELQVAMPELGQLSPQDWETSTYVPAVVIRPESDQAKLAQAYHLHHGPSQYSTLEAPDQLVLVISTNERISIRPRQAIPEQGLSPVLDLGDRIAYANAHVLARPLPTPTIIDPDGGNCCDNPDPVDPDPVVDPINCQRTVLDTRGDNVMTYHEMLYMFRFTSSTAFQEARDSWLDGRIELYIVGQRLITTTQAWVERLPTVSIRNADVKNLQWYVLDIMINEYAWHFNSGDRMELNWYEQDGGDWITQSTTVVGYFDYWDQTYYIPGSYSIQANDHHIGEGNIYYCDPVEITSSSNHTPQFLRTPYIKKVTSSDLEYLVYKRAW